MADFGIGEAMMVAELAGEAGTAEAAGSALGADALGSAFWGDMLGSAGTAMPGSSIISAGLPEALTYTPTWGDPFFNLASAAPETMTDAAANMAGGPSPIDYGSEVGIDPFGQRGAGVPSGNWYDMFFKPGGPNTGGITDFYKSMNMMGQLGVGSLGGTLLKSMMSPKTRVPVPEKYSGPLSKFSYNPSTFTPSVATPSVYTPHYAEGGIAALAQGGLNAPTGPVERMSQGVIGAGGMYPQSQMDKTYFATPTQMPASAEIIGADYDAKTNPYTGVMMAGGGIADLGGYSDGGRMLKGPGDGMSDSIPGTIDGKQPARLADGEFVVPADVVSHLGNGSTDAGAKRLYGMMDKVRKARTGTKKQGRQIKAEKYLPA